MRVGIGHDTHRLGEGGPLIVGGVTIEFSAHLVGHSDADVLLHAITDAILGALGLGDIGEWFPDTAPENRGRNSADFLQAAHNKAKELGFAIGNLDCIVFAQRPKLSPHKPAIRKRIAEILGIEEARINVKAKTGEKVGPVGREEAMMAECIVLLEKSP